MSTLTRNDVREAIIKAIKEKRPDEAHRAEEIADFTLSLPSINENTWETFMKTAGLL